MLPHRLAWARANAMLPAEENVSLRRVIERGTFKARIFGQRLVVRYPMVSQDDWAA
jgi:hypothetical protein